MKFFFHTLLLLNVFACTSKVKSKHEILYDDVSDSLVKYQEYILQRSDDSMKDFMSLDFESYKSKYKLNDKEMDQVSNTFKVSYEIAKISKSIRENMELSNDTDYRDGLELMNSLDSSKTDYAFHPEQNSPQKGVKY